MKVEGCNALVTGASGGLGADLVRALLERGAAHVYATSRSGVTPHAQDDRLTPLALDVTDPALVARTAASCDDTTLLINNAGVNHNAPLIEQAEARWAREEVEVNYLGTLTMCRAFAPVLKRNGGGAIINVISILGMINLPAIGSYAASKAATLSMTQGVRAELADQGTDVLAVMPGLIDTKMSAKRPGHKEFPSEVATAALDALENGDSYVYPGEMAKGVAAALRSDPEGLEQRFAAMLPDRGS